MSVFMRDFANRQGSLWLHLSYEELTWTLVAAVSFGIIIGLSLALAAVAYGGSL